MNNELHQSTYIIYRVFLWMAIAIGIGGIAALFVAQNPILLTRYPFVLPILFIAQLALVLTLTWRLTSLSTTTARMLFLVYSIMNGATLSIVFSVYTTTSIAQVFFISAGMFAGAALYGAYTKTNLAQFQNLLFMTLWGIIIALLVNFFLHNQWLDFIVSIIGVLLFSALTAYDIQNIQRMTTYLIAREEDWNKIALLGALQLYLDFINLFLSLLRLFGKRSE